MRALGTVPKYTREHIWVLVDFSNPLAGRSFDTGAVDAVGPRGANVTSELIASGIAASPYVYALVKSGTSGQQYRLEFTATIGVEILEEVILLDVE